MPTSNGTVGSRQGVFSSCGICLKIQSIHHRQQDSVASRPDTVPARFHHLGRLDMAVRFGGDVYLFGIKVVDIAPEGAFVFGQAAYGLAGGAIRRFTGASCDFFISNDRCDEEDMRVGADIEDNPLGQQRHVPGPSMIEEAIDGDSPDAVRAEARRWESEALTGMDGLDLADVEIMRHAWRCCDADPGVFCAVAGQNPASHSREGAR